MQKEKAVTKANIGLTGFLFPNGDVRVFDHIKKIFDSHCGNYVGVILLKVGKR